MLSIASADIDRAALALQLAGEQLKGEDGRPLVGPQHSFDSYRRYVRLSLEAMVDQPIRVDETRVSLEPERFSQEAP